MKRLLKSACLAAVFLALIPTLAAAADAPAGQAPAPVSPEVARLKSPDFAVRAEAGKFWWKQGPDAIETLTRLAGGRDRKLADWARDLLILIRATDKAAASPAAVEMGKKFLDTALSERKAVLDEFPEGDNGALPVLLALLRVETDSELRQALFERIQPHARFPLMIALYRLEEAPESRGWIVGHFNGSNSHMVALYGEEPDPEIRSAMLPYLDGGNTRAEIRNLLELYFKETDKPARQVMLRIMTDHLPQAVAPLILEGKLDAAAALLEEAATLEHGSAKRIVPHWAAFLLMTGKLDAKLAELSPPLEGAEGDVSGSPLPGRLREVKANADAARATDRKGPHPRSENAPLWKKRVQELQAALTPGPDGQNPNASESEALAHSELAALFGMLGDAAARAKEIAAIHPIAEQTASDSEERWLTVKALFLAGEVGGALALEARYGRAAEMDKYLQVCGRYHDAEDALRKLADDGTSAELDDLLFLADKMMEFGDRARAEKIAGRAAEVPLPVDGYIGPPFYGRIALFKKLGWDDKAGEFARAIDERLKASPELNGERALAAADIYKAGLKEMALTIFDQTLEHAKDAPQELAPIAGAELEAGLLDRAGPHFDRWAAAVAAAEPDLDYWNMGYPGEDWKKSRELGRDIRLAHVGEPPSASLKVLREILDLKGKARADVIRREAAIAGRIADPQDQSRWLEILSAECVGHDAVLARDLCLKSLSLAPSHDLCVRQARALAQQGRWKEAATWYEKAWSLGEDRPLAGDGENDEYNDAIVLYEWGRAMQKAGEEAEGRKKMDAADLMMLAEAGTRHSLSRSLCELGDKAGAEKQRKFILLVCPAEDNGTCAAAEEGIGDCLESRNWAAAERALTRDIARLWVNPNFNYIDPAGNVCFTAMNDLVRAHELLAGGDVAGAMEIIRRHQKANPANYWVPAVVVAELESRGHKAEAEEVFRKRLEVLEEACRRFPQDARRHNELAWYCATLARGLDEALEHSRRAIELSPADDGMLETLAEVRFQRGEFKEARETLQKCLEINPWALRAARRLREMDGPDEELKKAVGPWPLSRVWPDLSN